MSLNATGRQSPFKRQNSVSPANTVRTTTTPTQSPTKSTAEWSPSKQNSLSPEKASPFVRRPSQLSGVASERAPSPFTRPPSGLAPPSPTLRQGGFVRTVSEESGHSGDTRENNANTQIPYSARNAPSSPKATPSPFDGPATRVPSASVNRSQLNARPSASPTTASPSTFTPRASAATSNAKFTPAGAYTHVPPALLRSMRESFEVLDSNNSGTINSASVQTMLEQIGLDATPANIREFFSANGPAQLNLARYLDVLCGPLADLSQPDELSAAFGAFDVDDSGQIDIAELRKVLLDTVPEDGQRMSERDIDGILGQFAGRRAFGAKGLNAAKGKGEVFRYRDFMASVTGGGADGGMAEATTAA